MKKVLFIILLSLCSIAGSAQQNGYRSSPSDYMWKYVGDAGFSAWAADCISLAFSPSDGKPYIAFQDLGTTVGNATVMKFDGTSWVNVGNAGFTENEAQCTSLAFNPSDGQPYIAYVDYLYAQKVTVMKFDGTDWIIVGSTGFSADVAWWTTLAFSPSDDQPYVAYKDWGNSLKATVMKYDSVYVGINELHKLIFSLYPNPTSTQTAIETPTKGYLFILNLSGQQLLQQEITEPTTTIDVSTLPSGVYVVKLVGEKGVGIGKFIKQ
ncbi:MAG: T9SS type A sorting domain-containing protein [Bacteroidota bacterium]